MLKEKSVQPQQSNKPKEVSESDKETVSELEIIIALKLIMDDVIDMAMVYALKQNNGIV